MLDIEKESVTGDDILVLGTDGLWDVISNDEVANIVQRGLAAWDNESKEALLLRFFLCLKFVRAIISVFQLGPLFNSAAIPPLCPYICLSLFGIWVASHR